MGRAHNIGHLQTIPTNTRAFNQTICKKLTGINSGETSATFDQIFQKSAKLEPMQIFFIGSTVEETE